MTIDEALQKINFYRVTNTNGKSLKFLNKWNDLLIELKSMDLSNSELELLESELKVQLMRIEEAQQHPKVLKSSLKATLRFVNNMLEIKDSYKYTIIGAFVGIAATVIISISLPIGLLIGMATGYYADHYYNSKQRHIKTNLHDTW